MILVFNIAPLAHHHQEGMVCGFEHLRYACAMGKGCGDVLQHRTPESAQHAQDTTCKGIHTETKKYWSNSVQMLNDKKPILQICCKPHCSALHHANVFIQKFLAAHACYVVRGMPNAESEGTDTAMASE